ncbi:MAG: patatin-like phospholipase family protein [Pseudomonadota bacterium]|nr:patatin [Pseudomonadales bacterium]MDY6921058.1 patatin-like phospholipase family protein [Pseudomonadota bacterium]
MAAHAPLKIGVALGSGSARGWSHIGVLKQLMAMGIEPDVVAGTSIGALVGSCYAAGKLQQLEDWVVSLGWRDVVSLLDVKFSGGLIEGRKVFQFFREHLPDYSFKDLDKKFAAVATDLESGREVWLQHGHLAEAVRSSISLPGLFTPYRTQNGRYLVDGGLVNPVPVSLCRALGADLVIAVNLNAELVGRHLRSSRRMSEEFAADSPAPVTDAEELPPESGEASEEQKELRRAESDFFSKVSQLFSDWGQREPANAAGTTPGMMEVMASSINIMQDRVTRSRMAGDPPDLVLTPRLAHIGLMEFYRAAEAIAEGEKTVHLAEPQLYDLLGEELPEHS